MLQINNENLEALARNIGQFRRAIWHDLVFNIVHVFSDFGFSLIQMATLLFLEEAGEPTIKQVAEILGRSVSATSRLLDQLVERGWVSRREDEQDRRVKRVAITESGRAFVAMMEQQRAQAQLTVMEYLSAKEQAEVARAMELLAEAGKRRRSHEYPESTTTASEQRSGE